MIEDGILSINPLRFLDNTDWLIATDLAKKAAAGDKDAAKELERRGKTKVIRI